MSMRRNQSHVLGSIAHSLTCSHFHTPDPIPIWFIRRRSMAINLSSRVRNLASIGESGMKMLFCVSILAQAWNSRHTYYMTTENVTVMHPQNKKMIYATCKHSCNGEFTKQSSYLIRVQRRLYMAQTICQKAAELHLQVSDSVAPSQTYS